MSLELTEIPDHVSASPEPADESTPKEEATSIGDINFCLRYQSAAFSFKLPVPADCIANLYQFHSSIRDRLLDSGKCRNNELQLNLWPLITASHSATVIGPHQSGKTTAYVLFLLNKFWLGGYIQKGITADQMMSKSSPVFQPQRIFGAKIYAIILVDSMLSVIHTGNEFFKWLRILIGLPPKVEVEVNERPGSFTEHDNDTVSGAFRRSHAQRNQYSIRINLLHEKSLLADYFDVLNGCAVLISTAGALAKLIRLNLITLNDNKVFIIDHADEFINSSTADVVDLFSLTGSPMFNFVTDRQTILFAQNWTDDIKRFFFEVQQKPILVLSSLVDATVLFQQAKANIELCPANADDTNERVERIILQLSGQARREPTIGAVICSSYEQVKSLATSLLASKRIDQNLLKVFTLTADSTAIELNRISVQLVAFNPNCGVVKLVLLCADDLFNFALYYRKFNCLIHLDRFEQYDIKSNMNYRLLLVYDNLIGTGTAPGSEELFQMEQLSRLNNLSNGSSAEEARSISNYFLLMQSSYNEERFRTVVTELLDYCDQLMFSNGDDRTRHWDYMNQELVQYVRTVLENNICPQFAAFAKCKALDKGMQCWKGRHTLHQESVEGKGSETTIGPNMQIRFRLLHIVDTNQFFIRLLSYRSENQPTGEWIATNDHLQMERLKQLLSRYKQMRYLHKFKVISSLAVNQMYILYHYDDMLRVRLLKIYPLTGSEDLPIWLSTTRAVNMTDEELQFFKLTVEVLAVDVGRTISTRAYNLIELDSSDPDTEVILREIPSLSYRVYLADIAPPDGEYTWENLTRSKLSSINTNDVLLQMAGSSDENSLTGWILAREQDTLWLHYVILSKRLHALGVNQYILLADDLIRNGAAIRNDRKFPGCDYDAGRRVAALWRSNSEPEHQKKPPNTKLSSPMVELEEDDDDSDETSLFGSDTDGESEIAVEKFTDVDGYYDFDKVLSDLI